MRYPVGTKLVCVKTDGPWDKGMRYTTIFDGHDWDPEYWQPVAPVAVDAGDWMPRVGDRVSWKGYVVGDGVGTIISVTPFQPCFVTTSRDDSPAHVYFDRLHFYELCSPAPTATPVVAAKPAQPSGLASIVAVDWSAAIACEQGSGIAAKSLPTPEPWRPGVSEWDLLPEWNERGTR